MKRKMPDMEYRHQNLEEVLDAPGCREVSITSTAASRLTNNVHDTAFPSS